MEVAIKKISTYAKMPVQGSLLAAGYDLCAALAESVVLEPAKRMLVPTGIAIALPAGAHAQIRPRSGLAIKKGITVLNTPGTIDADYRGEIQVLLINLGQEPCELAPGERIAQLVVAPVARAEWVEVEELPPTGRGEGGFGSTGTAS